MVTSCAFGDMDMDEDENIFEDDNIDSVVVSISLCGGSNGLLVHMSFDSEDFS